VHFREPKDPTRRVPGVATAKPDAHAFAEPRVDQAGRIRPQIGFARGGNFPGTENHVLALYKHAPSSPRAPLLLARIAPCPLGRTSHRLPVARDSHLRPATAR
jgi:hypothetical protein